MSVSVSNKVLNRRFEPRLTRRSAMWRLIGGAVASSVPSMVAFGAQARPQIPALQYPLATNGRILLGFGAVWQWSKGCDNQYKRHVGVDVEARPGTKVLAAETGVVRIAFVEGQWKGCVVVEHADRYGRLYTTTYWHVDFGRLAAGAVVRRGGVIGTVSDLNGLTTNHLHFGLRTQPYSSVAQRGALPYSASCVDNPQYPEWFVRGL